MLLEYYAAALATATIFATVLGALVLDTRRRIGVSAELHRQTFREARGRHAALLAAKSQIGELGRAVEHTLMRVEAFERRSISTLERISTDIDHLGSRLNSDDFFSTPLQEIKAGEQRINELLTTVDSRARDSLAEVSALHARISEASNAYAQVQSEFVEATNAAIAALDPESRIELAERRLHGSLDQIRQYLLSPQEPDPQELQRELLASIGDLRSLAAQPQDCADTTQAASRRAKGSQGGPLDATSARMVAEIEALFRLSGQISPRAVLPPSGDWALDAQSLAHLVELIQETAPRRVLEFGSGTSTVWLGYLLERTGGHLTALEHNRDYFEQTRKHLRSHNLEHVVTLLHCRLSVQQIGETDQKWYDMTDVDMSAPYDLVLVDGPPKSTGTFARMPAIYSVEQSLARQAVVALDDCDRPDEQEILRRWADDFPDFSRVDTRGSRLGVLRRSATRNAG
ncbi:protein-L-isoaspartate O-methyltransferase [Cellulomonas bogoriensis 69B4 = DSM 16987]|uniref:Protein-L-isoaspartate O-methyltransferase n=1 Tax=Cellulomonas bogoriensis 69B4 = DSM 16987 TaxID=1386082 RepID=A0A0A0C1J8_9CELL|nr:protein-L-isoaspartate O-methyltransferase [Cellulomonas bogoriensis 69B4 = DSM 16987]